MHYATLPALCAHTNNVLLNRDKNTMPKLVILDRDGVINYDSDSYIKSAQEWQPIPGSIEAIAQLSQSGIKVAVATNQSGLYRGLFTQADLQAMHDKMQRLITDANGHLSIIAYCSDGPNSGSLRRKPAPGMLIEIAEALTVPLSDVMFVGDSYSDYGAAQAAGCEFVLVRSGKGERTLAQHPELLDHVVVFDNLQQATQSLLEQPQ